MLKASITIIVSFLLISSVHSQDGVWIPSFKYNCDTPEKVRKTYNSGNLYIISGDSIFSVDVNNSFDSNVVSLGAKFTREGSSCKVDKSLFGFPWGFEWIDESNFVVSQNNECYNYRIVKTPDFKKVNSKFTKSIFEKFYVMNTNIEEYNYDFNKDTISFKSSSFDQEYLYKNIESRIIEIDGKLFMAAFFIRPSIFPIVELDKNLFKLESSYGEKNELIEFRSIKVSNPKEKVKKAFYDGTMLIEEENNDTKN